MVHQDPYKALTAGYVDCRVQLISNYGYETKTNKQTTTTSFSNTSRMDLQLEGLVSFLVEILLSQVDWARTGLHQEQGFHVPEKRLLLFCFIIILFINFVGY